MNLSIYLSIILYAYSNTLLTQLDRGITFLNGQLHRIQHKLSLATYGRPPHLGVRSSTLNNTNQARKLPHHVGFLWQMRLHHVLTWFRDQTGYKLIEPQVGGCSEGGLILLERDDVVVDMEGTIGPYGGDVHGEVRQEGAVESGYFSIFPK